MRHLVWVIQFHALAICFPNVVELFLPVARREFRAFYFTATAGDSGLMDELLRTYAAVTLAIKAPRSPANPLRDHLERVTDDTERAYTAAREAVRGCQTFRNLCAGDRRRIESVLFAVYPPWGKP